MSKNVLIFGDSNVHHLTFFYKDNNKNIGPHNIPAEHFGKIKLLEDNITCIWKYSSSGIRFNDQYIYTKAKYYGVNINDYSHIVYQFGNNDIRNKMTDPSEIPDFVKRYVDAANSFAIKNNLIPVFTTPIVHQDLVDLDLLSSYIKELKRYCQEASILLVDVYDIMDNNFKCYEWDVWLHPEEGQSKKILEHVLNNI